MQKHLEGARELTTFSSLADMTEHSQRAVNPENQWLLDYHRQPLEDKDSPKFYGFTTQAELDQCMAAGWPQGTDRILSLQGKLFTLPDVAAVETRMRRKRCRAEDGTDVDMDRVRLGRLDIAWETRKRQPRETRAVTIVCEIAASSTTEHDRLFWRGACAVVLAEAYERAGYMCELWCGLALHSLYTDQSAIGTGF